MCFRTDARFSCKAVPCARYRNRQRCLELLEPDRIYRLEIDLWATANRFKAGHRLRPDLSSADFPKFDRNANRGGEPGEPIPGQQRIYSRSRASLTPSRVRDVTAQQTSAEEGQKNVIDHFWRHRHRRRFQPSDRRKIDMDRRRTDQGDR